MRTDQNETAEPTSAAEVYSSAFSCGGDGPAAGEAGREGADTGDDRQRHPVREVHRRRSLQEQRGHQDPEEERVCPHADPRQHGGPEAEVADRAKLLPPPSAVRSQARTDEEFYVLVRLLVRVNAVDLAEQSRSGVPLPLNGVLESVAEIVHAATPILRFSCDVRRYPDAQFIILVGR